ncbi:DNA cytosine methyltransferase [Billgrantia sp. Q4P2]|uniref:DNA cytosine methyltransferase n=1 Tax=Billgrantia sp. Q4P2 TaxID=3463857 RepID=UPI00405777FD
MDSKRTYKAISLYTGAGGLDYGFEAAGFETSIALESDPWCCKTLRKNRHWEVIEKSIFDIDASDLVIASGMRKGEADILIGGPPCQPFSKSGFWATGDSKRLLDERAGTLESYFKVLDSSLPKSFLLENVPGLTFNGKSEGIDLINRLIREINVRNGTSYNFSVMQLNAADYGVPQQRERVFIIGSRDGINFNFPERKYSQNWQGEFSHFTAWDAIGDISISRKDLQDLKMSGKWADLLKSIPEGYNYLYHTERGEGEALFGWRRRYWNFLLKLAKERPAWTIQAQPGPATGPFHWDNRKLSIIELSRLQTFPHDVEIIGNFREAQRQVGNAVPSLLAEVLAREISVQLLGRSSYDDALTLLPMRKRPIPPPTPISPVDEKYLKLRGAHEPHPGTGLGNRAKLTQNILNESLF